MRYSTKSNFIQRHGIILRIGIINYTPTDRITQKYYFTPKYYFALKYYITLRYYFTLKYYITSKYYIALKYHITLRHYFTLKYYITPNNYFTPRYHITRQYIYLSVFCQFSSSNERIKKFGKSLVTATWTTYERITSMVAFLIAAGSFNLKCKTFFIALWLFDTRGCWISRLEPNKTCLADTASMTIRMLVSAVRVRTLERYATVVTLGITANCEFLIWSSTLDLLDTVIIGITCSKMIRWTTARISWKYLIFLYWKIKFCTIFIYYQKFNTLFL